MKVQIITKCPSCNCILTRVKDQLFCTNNACDAVAIKRIEHFAKTLKIMGLGIKTIEKLNLKSIKDIYNLNLEYCSTIIGNKLATKLINEIEKSKNQNLSTFLTSFSIPLFGKTASTKIATIVNSIDEITIEKCKEAGIGDKATNNLLSWIAIKEYVDLPINIIINKSISNDILVCISGKLLSYKTKADAEKVLADNNISVTSNISKKVNFLISEDEKESSKVKKAREYNIPILTMEQLLKENK